MFTDLITATILNSTCFFKVSNKHFKYITYIWQALGRVTFCNYIVTTISFFVITIHYVNIVLTPTLRTPIIHRMVYSTSVYHQKYLIMSAGNIGRNDYKIIVF